jgi:succinate-semialdehyde dehydrogenase/glutarate-semialdehyde dehydrogenase
MKITGINPTTGDVLDSRVEMTEAEIEAKLRPAARASREWRQASFGERCKIIKSAGKALLTGRAEFAQLMAREMGKPVSQGRAEVEKCAACCDYYADKAESFLRPELVATEASKSFVVFEPLGTLLAVMPWNFPFWQVFRAAVPALMAGNAVVLKHASNVFGCAEAIERVFRGAGVPDGLFCSLIIGSKRVGELIHHPSIQAVTLTGSTEAGKSVAAQAGAALKKCVLELGGSDPYVVLADADIEAAAETCVNSRLINTGQSCIAAKRFIVVESVRARFEEMVVEKMRKRQPGDPLDEKTTLGPLARHDLRDTLHAQVQRSVSEGATLRLGGTIPSGKGAFYPPTVLTNVSPKMTAFREETFGPVDAIIGAENEGRAI